MHEYAFTDTYAYLMGDFLDYFFFHNKPWECDEGGQLGRGGEASGRADLLLWDL